MSSVTSNTNTVTKTKNPFLQEALEGWVDQLSDIYTLMSDTALSSGDRQSTLWRPLDTFVRSFAPLDVTEDDIAHFRDSLIHDEEFFVSFLRELAQCTAGEYVEAIQGNQRQKATFVLLPPPELCKFFPGVFMNKQSLIALIDRIVSFLRLNSLRASFSGRYFD
jgi:hypothetical protein